MFMLPSVTGSAQRLGVAQLVQATKEAGNNMVKFETLSGATPGTRRSSPVFTLVRCPLCVTDTASYAVKALWHHGLKRHHVRVFSALCPQFAGRRANLLQFFGGVSIPKSVGIAKGFAFTVARNGSLGRLRMLFPMEGVPLPLVKRINASTATGFCSSFLYITLGTIKDFSAMLAGKVRAISNAWHDLSLSVQIG
jgi:hypothetical protein